ncbi:Ribulose bisphosphate carboxylase-like protein [Pirellulimonas nuda]|uniref:Ribulose bisphosphate carboxylase-like protein n=1 Tax=Pirellulimonas nuda TaxID=2528009 RepID=A0A518DG15_9BACT|nr:ribulose-bisphosphate carboxylase large subunit family protein [Pirellulimonas nuda]QDU90417.1 Ribulose bisphosphate carboxylase-like protein [Pirellulimonas nuda]
MTDRLHARYLVETPLKVEDAAAVLAGEQSSGTFVAVPGETDALKQRFSARVEQIELLESVGEPSLPGCRGGAGAFQRAEIEVSWSLENIGFNLPTLISTVQGNLYELSQFSGLRLLDLEFPSEYQKHYQGPRFGVAGTRRLAGVVDRPLIGTIIKPSVGLSPSDTAALVQTLVDAGIDFIKDDELMANPPHSPFDDRVAAVMRVVRDHQQRTGKLVMVAFNITDELDAMLRHYDTVVQAGGSAAMISLNSVGPVASKRICDRGQLAIHGHRNGWGMLNRCPMLGMDFAAYQKIWRLVGVDQLHVNGIQNKFWEPDDSVVRSIEALRRPMFGGYQALPVVSSGQWGGQAPETYRRTRTIDLLYMAGGGVLAHPGGPASGVRALNQAWDAAVAGLSLEEAALGSPELAQSLAAFGGAAKRTPSERKP